MIITFLYLLDALFLKCLRLLFQALYPVILLPTMTITIDSFAPYAVFYTMLTLHIKHNMQRNILKIKDFLKYLNKS
ncbi:MAG: hypothetical protein COA93_00375 [Alphaproteobacteria bacterium]|nr:MAG: hypothetical protein COA93_00375 [Alphaproteobacteria bacterium]